MLEVFNVVNKKWWKGLLLFCLLISPHDTEGALQFTPSISLSERYEDNIFYSNYYTDSVDDFIRTLSYQLAFSYDGAKGSGSLSYQAGLESYLENEDLNTVRHNGSVNFNYPLSKSVNLNLTEGFTFTPDSTEVNPLGIQVGRGDSYSNSFSVDIATQASNFLIFRIGYNNQIIEFDEPSLSDSMAWGMIVGIDYQLTKRNTLNLNYSYRYFTTDIPWSSILHSLNIGERHQFSPTFTISTNIGATYLPDTNNYRLLIGVNLNKSFKGTSVGFGYSRDASIGSGVSGETLINQRVSVSMTRSLLRNLTANVGGGYSTNDSLTGDVVAIESYNFRIGTGYTFTQWLRGDLSYLFFQQERGRYSQVGEDIRRNQVQLMLTATYPSLLSR